MFRPHWYTILLIVLGIVSEVAAIAYYFGVFWSAPSYGLAVPIGWTIYTWGPALIGAVFFLAAWFLP